MRNFSLKKQSGFSLIEVIIATSIIGLVSVTVFASFSLVTSYAHKNTATLQAAFLLEEGAENIRILRDFGWTANIASLTPGISYRFVWDSAASTWKATTTVVLIDSKFDRTFVLSNINRDGSHNIVTSGGTSDAGSRMATITVSWLDGGATTTRSLATYIFNTFIN